jgi:hypothetical protein
VAAATDVGELEVERRASNAARLNIAAIDAWCSLCPDEQVRSGTSNARRSAVLRGRKETGADLRSPSAAKAIALMRCWSGKRLGFGGAGFEDGRVEGEGGRWWGGEPWWSR